MTIQLDRGEVDGVVPLLADRVNHLLPSVDLTEAS